MRHNRLWIAAALASAATSFTVRTAHAQEQRHWRYRVMRPHAAPVDAFELQVGTGYTQGFGSAAPSMDLPSVAGAGLAVDVAAAYRATPYWSVGVQGQFAEYTPELNTAARGATANLGVTYHFTPFDGGDPWLRLGTGWRWLWSVNPPGMPTTGLDGWQAVKANLGYDVRLSEGVAIAPQVGADLTVFSWVTQAGYTNPLSASSVGVFINAGIQGRFDLGPKAVPASYVGSAR